jgi:hypothetical protein
MSLIAQTYKLPINDIFRLQLLAMKKYFKIYAFTTRQDLCTTIVGKEDISKER